MNWKLSIIALIIAVGGISLSANNANKELKRIHWEKVVAPAAAELVWFEYMDKAYAESEKTGKPIMANFTGSDWCGWCIRLHNEVFSTDEFKQWADDNVVLLELDYPKRKALPEDLRAQNNSLQQFFQVGGFPTIWIFDVTLNKETNEMSMTKIGKTGYVAGGPAEWISKSDLILANR